MALSELKFSELSTPYIVAEIGNNHLGSVDLAKHTIDAAADCGVDAVKFQLFDPEKLVTADQPVLSHVPDKREKTQRERFRRMALSYNDMDELSRYCKQKQIDFLCTPFDLESLYYLVDKVPFIKIASGDANYRLLIESAKDSGLPVAISTGLCSLRDIDNAVSWIDSNNSVVMHCVSSYPTPDHQANLGVIDLLKKRYGIPVGYSCHTKDLFACLIAAAKGVCLIEKHFILAKSLPAGDQSVSLDATEMLELVTSIRRLGDCLGVNYNRKAHNQAEDLNKTVLRRSPYLTMDVKAGDEVLLSNLSFLRPFVEGTVDLSCITKDSSWRAKHDLEAGLPLKYDDLLGEEGN